MLKIDVPGEEFYDEENERFIELKPTTLLLENSLIAISKWESKYHVPFLENDEKTKEQWAYYVQCMTINSNVDPLIYKFIQDDQMEEIMDYIKDPMTATWFSDDSKSNKKKVKKEIVTSELIYYWMIALNIPSEYEKWHIQRLITLVRICNIKNSSDSKKLSKRETLQDYDALNEARKAKFNTKG